MLHQGPSSATPRQPTHPLTNGLMSHCGMLGQGEVGVWPRVVLGVRWLGLLGADLSQSLCNPPTVSRDKYIHVDEMAYESLERTMHVDCRE